MQIYTYIYAGIMNMMREKIPKIGTINERMKNIERVKKKKIYERMMIRVWPMYFNFVFPPDLPDARSFCAGP